MKLKPCAVHGVSVDLRTIERDGHRATFVEMTFGFKRAPDAQPETILLRMTLAQAEGMLTSLAPVLAPAAPPPGSQH